MRNKPFLVGAGGALALLALYFAILSWANSFSHALEQLASLWFWVGLLVIGFGIQVGLYAFIRSALRKRMAHATAEVAVAGGISTGSMIACCAHHLTDVLPILGLSAAAVFLAKYQMPFIYLGVASNAVGITLMLGIIQRHNLYAKTRTMQWIFGYNMDMVRNIVIVLAVVIVAGAFLWAVQKPSGIRRASVDESQQSTVELQAPPISPALPAEKSTQQGRQDGQAVVREEGTVSSQEEQQKEGTADDEENDSASQEAIELPAKINSEGGVSFEVKPLNFSFGEPVVFDIAINTHQGSLDFDLTAVAVMVDDKGTRYEAIEWDGSPPSGHHRFGKLKFPSLNKDATAFKLIIKDVYGVPERAFEWELPR